MTDEPEIKHEGLHADRLAPNRSNPREVAFAEEWKKENDPERRQFLLAHLLLKEEGIAFFSQRVVAEIPYDQQSASVAATVIQWLGSNVGFDFLRQSLRRVGLRVVDHENRDA